ncbi:MAG: DUF3180 domain-containing protein [Jiangellales bacterium]
MTPTRPPTLLVAGITGLVVGFSLAGLSDRLGSGLPRVSWVSIGLLLFLAALIVVATRRARAWVSGERPQQPGDALMMGRFVALAKAGSLFGALMVGGYLGLAAVGLDRVSTDYGRDHVLWALGGALGATSVLVAALLLERALQLPSDTDGGATGATR